MTRKRDDRKKSKPAVVPAGPAPPAVAPRAESPSWTILGVRVWLAVMFGVTWWVTRRLWDVHDDPPMLPLVDLPRFPYFGVLMVAGYAVAVWWPRAGLLASVVVGAVAMAADQARMQPTIFSLWLLMLGTWPRAEARFVARCHVASLWFFSGFHKLLSDDYLEIAGPWLFGGIFPPDDWPRMVPWRTTGAIVMAALEVALGIAVFIPRLRKIVAVGAVLLHVGIVVTLHRLQDWNTAVWPWNLGLAVVAPWLILSWRDSLVGDWKSVRPFGFAAGVALALSPALYYVGLLDAYLSHCLYSMNVPQAVFVGVDATSSPSGNPTDFYLQTLNVPLPPEHRNFENYFRRRAAPGDKMYVNDPRPWFADTDYGDYVLVLEGGVVVRKPQPKTPAD